MRSFFLWLFVAGICPALGYVSWPIVPTIALRREATCRVVTRPSFAGGGRRKVVKSVRMQADADSIMMKGKDHSRSSNGILSAVWRSWVSFLLALF